MKLVLLGPPGAGKGTHAKVLTDKFKIAHLAAGDILRRNIREDTELGKTAKSIIEKGNLVSDDLVNRMMFDEISKLDPQQGFVLDGYPRTIGQAEALDLFLANKGNPLDVVINFDTSEKVVIERLSGRRICPQCNANYHLHNIPPKVEGICDQCGAALVQRKDDKPETITNRLKNYEHETAPLINYYKKQGLLSPVHGDYEVPELQQELSKLFERLNLTV